METAPYGDVWSVECGVRIRCPSSLLRIDIGPEHEYRVLLTLILSCTYKQPLPCNYCQQHSVPILPLPMAALLTAPPLRPCNRSITLPCTHSTMCTTCRTRHPTLRRRSCRRRQTCGDASQRSAPALTPAVGLLGSCQGQRRTPEGWMSRGRSSNQAPGRLAETLSTLPGPSLQQQSPIAGGLAAGLAGFASPGRFPEQPPSGRSLQQAPAAGGLAADLAGFASRGGVVLVTASTSTDLGRALGTVCATPLALLRGVLGEAAFGGCGCYDVAANQDGGSTGGAGAAGELVGRLDVGAARAVWGAGADALVAAAPEGYPL
eukprot:350051-Chlamydomonas_euryale.AAC.1